MAYNTDYRSSRNFTDKMHSIVEKYYHEHGFSDVVAASYRDDCGQGIDYYAYYEEHDRQYSFQERFRTASY